MRDPHPSDIASLLWDAPEHPALEGLRAKWNAKNEALDRAETTRQKERQQAKAAARERQRDQVETAVRAEAKRRRKFLALAVLSIVLEVGLVAEALRRGVNETSDLGDSAFGGVFFGVSMLAAAFSGWCFRRAMMTDSTSDGCTGCGCPVLVFVVMLHAPLLALYLLTM